MTAEIATGWVLGKALERTGPSTVGQFGNLALVFTAFLLDYCCNCKMRTERANEGRGEFHNFGENFPSNKATLLSFPPPLYWKGVPWDGSWKCKCIKWWLVFYQTTRYNIHSSIFPYFFYHCPKNFCQLDKLRRALSLWLLEGFWNLFFTEKAPFGGTREASREMEGRGGRWRGRGKGEGGR